MMTVVLTFVILLMVVAVMAVGVLFGRKPIKGSCGGMAALGMKESCDICGGDQQRCENESRRAGEQAAASGKMSLAYDASHGDRPR